jgi:GNAT superfamily N-acetyltransferase
VLPQVLFSTMPTILIRPARPDEAGLVTAITHEAYARWVAVIGREPLPMTVDYRDAMMRHRFDLLCEDEAVSGLIETVRRDDALLIENVCVRPQAQGRGHGRRLIAHAEALARAEGLGFVRLYTNQRFAENLRFYAGLGYAVERDEPFRGGVMVHLAKAI